MWRLLHQQNKTSSNQGLSHRMKPRCYGALTSLKMTADFILQSDGLTYFISKPTSDAQLKAMKEYLDRKGWWYEVK